MKRDLDPLVSPAFLAALLLLLGNDFLFKPLFHDALTGKLSDFAGLFAFSIFLSVLAPRRRLAVHLLTALAFIFWKTPYSQPLIERWNALGLLTVSRTIDPTDLVALSVLPFSNAYLRRQERLRPAVSPSSARRVAKLAVVLLSVFAFAATQRAGDHMITEEREYEFRMTTGELLQHLQKDIGLKYVSHYRFDDDFVKESERIEGREWTEEDRNEYSFNTPTKVCNDTVHATVTLHQKEAVSAMKIDYLIYNCDVASPEREREAVSVFERDVVERLRALKPAGP